MTSKEFAQLQSNAEASRTRDKDLKKPHIDSGSIIRPAQRQGPPKASSTKGKESQLICRSAHDQNGAFLLDCLERKGRLPEGASLEHSGDMTCVIRWKKGEWKFRIE